LYEQGKIRHCGRFIELEDEMAGFSTQGYIGNASPNRVDAWIWVLTELFPGMIRDRAEKKFVIPKKPLMLTRNGNFGGNWM
jgi:phage terminase large subunit-like protein